VRRVQNDQLYAAFGRVRHTPDAAGPARARLPEEGRHVHRGRGGFGVGRTTVWRYVNETVDLLAARAPKLRAAVRDAKKAGQVDVILDGTLIPIDRVATDRPF
jgi:hypothetical protein